MDNTKSLWSYSRVTCFSHCKYEFYLNYIVHDDNLYLSECNYYAEVGSYVHKILAMIFEGELKLEDAIQYYIDHYDENICYKAMQSTMDRNYMLIAEYFADLELDWIENYEIVGVELEAKFKVEDYDFIGYIDLLLRDKRDGKFVVLDHKSSPYPFTKSGSVKKTAKESFELYKKQMHLYCHAVKQLYGDFPKEMTWNHFKDKGQLATIPFVKSEYQETMKWFLDSLKEIEQERDFEPTEEFFYCNNLCNFRNSCEYKVLSSEVEG